MKEIYLDNAATSRPHREVIKHMGWVMEHHYANPSSLHKKGGEVEKLLRECRQVVAGRLKCEENEIIFTSGGTESTNLAIKGSLDYSSHKRTSVITSKIEHPATLEVVKYLEQKSYDGKYVAVDSRGIIDLDDFKEKISEDACLVSIMHVNNEIGTIQPVKEIGKIIKAIAPRCVYHVDMAQSLGKINDVPCDFGADLATITAHKLHGPKGIGVLYKRRGLKISPLIHGGGQEYNIRSGTENLAGICGFAKALKLLENNDKKIKDLKRYLIERIKSELHDVIINGDVENSIPHILNISIQGVKGEVLVHSLEMDGIYVSTGAACSSKNSKTSHVLEAMGRSNDDMDGAIRISMSGNNNREEIDLFIDSLKKHVEDLRLFYANN